MLHFLSCRTVKLRDLPLSAITVLLHYLPNMSAVSSHMRQNGFFRIFKWDSLPYYCYTIKTNSRTICSQVLQPASAGKGADMSESQDHHYMTPEQWTWLLCSVSVILTNKLSLQELNQLIEIKLLSADFRFSRNFWFLDPISRGANAHFADAHVYDIRD